MGENALLLKQTTTPVIVPRSFSPASRYQAPFLSPLFFPPSYLSSSLVNTAGDHLSRLATKTKRTDQSAAESSATSSIARVGREKDGGKWFYDTIQGWLQYIPTKSKMRGKRAEVFIGLATSVPSFSAPKKTRQVSRSGSPKEYARGQHHTGSNKNKHKHYLQVQQHVRQTPPPKPSSTQRSMLGHETTPPKVYGEPASGLIDQIQGHQRTHLFLTRKEK